MKNSESTPAHAGGRAAIAVRYNDLGQPTMRFRKDLLAVGTYTPPNGAWTLNVDSDRMHKLARTFAEMRAAGVSVPVIAADERGRHNWHPDNARGYLRDAAIEGDRLIGEIELVGEDAVRLAGRTEVSVGIHPDFRDGRGKDYGEAIDHVAVCLNPIVPNQQSWRIAASCGGQADDRVELHLSAAKECQSMDEVYQFLSTICGKSVNADNYEEAMKEYLQAQSDKFQKKSDDHAAAAQQLTLERDELRARVMELEMVAAGVAKSIEMSREAQEEALDAVDERLGLLVERAKITPAVKNRLAEAFSGAGAYALSRVGSSRSLARQVVDALAENDPVRLGEQSRGQSVAVNRRTPDDTGGDVAAGAQFVEQQMAAIGVAPAKKG